jgi:hypothetical protein
MHKKGLKDTRLVACTLALFLINSNYLDIFIQFTLRWGNWPVVSRGLLCLTRWTSLAHLILFPIDFLQKNNLPKRFKKSWIMLIYKFNQTKKDPTYLSSMWWTCYHSTWTVLALINLFLILLNFWKKNLLLTFICNERKENCQCFLGCIVMYPKLMQQLSMASPSNFQIAIWIKLQW